MNAWKHPKFSLFGYLYKSQRFLGIFQIFREDLDFYRLGGRGVPDLGIVKIKFFVVFDRGEPQLPNAFY